MKNRSTQVAAATLITLVWCATGVAQRFGELPTRLNVDIQAGIPIEMAAPVPIESWEPTESVDHSILAETQWDAPSSPSSKFSSWTARERDVLIAKIEKVIDELDDHDLPSPHGSKRAFLKAVDRTRSFLKENTSARNYLEWMEYLDVDELLQDLNDPQAMKSDRMARAIGRMAVQLKYRLVGIAKGLELPVIQNLRETNEQMISAIRFRDNERSIKGLTKQLENLAEAISEMEDVPTADDLSTMNQTIVLLEQACQSPELVSDLRSRFRNPNIRVLVAEHVVQSFVNRGVNESRPVQECILGTRIVGTATLGGLVTANLLPYVGSVRMQVQLAGHISSQNTGYNGPVVLRTVGQGQVNASRTLYIDESGIRADPVVAQASLDTSIVAIEHRMRLVRRIARRKANEQKPNADRIALGKLRSQVGQQFTKQTNEAMSFTPPDTMSRIGPLLQRLNLSVPQRLLGSTDNTIFVNATFAAEDQLAAPGYQTGSGNADQAMGAQQAMSAQGAIPSVRHAYDMALQIHESAIDNAISPILAGRTVTEEDLLRLIPGLAMKSDEKPQQDKKPQPKNDTDFDLENEQEEDKEKEDEPFELEFARLRPIIFEARDQTIKLGIRGARFTQGKRTIRQTLEITANYQPARMADGTSVLVRQGDVEVDFPGRKGKMSVSQTGLKASIKKKFANVFPDTLMHRALTVPPSVEMKALAGRSFRPQTIDAEHGWMTITVLQ